MITIIDYGSGNLHAIATLLKRSDVAFDVATDAASLARAERILLPGVGAFNQTMSAFEDSGMVAAIKDRVASGRATCLGICVGMHCLSNGSEEGEGDGLGFVPGSVIRFDETRIPDKPRLPHMGWNSVEGADDHPLLAGIDHERGFYFLHSYHYRCDDARDVIGTTTHGYGFHSVVGRGNIYGVQFHPEKSHANGVRLIRNFLQIAPC